MATSGKVYYGVKIGYGDFARQGVEYDEDKESWTDVCDHHIKLTKNISKCFVDGEHDEKLTKESMATNNESYLDYWVVGVLLNEGSGHYQGVMEVPTDNAHHNKTLETFFEQNQWIRQISGPRVYAIYERRS